MAVSPLAHVLIVEDDEDLLEVLKYVLEDANCKVATATDGPEALYIASSETIDLVILDISLTRMSGFEVARSLRLNSPSAPPMIAVHTGLPESEVRAELPDFDLYLQKGDDVREFLLPIQRLLANGREPRPGAKEGPGLVPGLRPDRAAAAQRGTRTA